MARILVLDGHSVAALAFVRSLGRAGHWVAVGTSEGATALAELSRFCNYSCRYPGPTRGITPFLRTVEKFSKESGIDLVLPMTDATQWPLASRAGRWEAGARLGVPSEEAVRRASDKHWAIVTASQCHVSAPESLLVGSLADLQPARGWRYPVVVKDRYSIRWSGELAVAGSVAYAYRWEELVRTAEARLARAGDVLVQQFAPGVGIGFSAFVIDGEIRLPFQWRRIREKDPRGSGSSARRSVPVDGQVLSQSQALLDRAGFEGIAMVEFKQDVATGCLSLMEINGRPWGSMHLPLCCGIDYPRWLADWYLERQVPPLRAKYPTGVTCRWLTADLVHLENLWNGPPPGWPTPYPSFLHSLLAVSLPWYPGLRYDEFLMGDLRPGLAQLGGWLRAHLPRSAGRNGRNNT